MTPITRWKRKVALGLGCLAVLILLGISESHFERFQAARLLTALSAIQVGITPQAEAQKAIKPFARFNNKDQFPKDGNENSFDQFFFSNRAFKFLHLAPATWVWITVDYKNGIVVSKSAQYAEEPRCSGSIVESVSSHNPDEDPLREFRTNGRSIHVGGSAPSPVFIMKVDDDTSASTERRHLDWQIDLHCMTHIGGCRDPRKVLYGAMLEEVTK